MAKIELPDCWASVAEPLRALMAEIDREAQTHHHAKSPDPAVMRDASRSVVRQRINDAKATREQVGKRWLVGTP